MSKKIVVTGGAGFIGSHVVDAYIAAGHRVAVIDDLSTGSKKNLNPKARFYKADVRDIEKLRGIMRREKPDVVNHHAAKISVTESVRNPQPTLEVNVVGTANVALVFGELGPKAGRKMIFISSGGSIYGNPKRLPAPETTPASPLSPYALSKKLGEEVVEFYARQFGFTYLALRYANVYGPRQSSKGEGGVVAIFGDLMKSQKQPTIFGDGTKQRDYVFVGDVAQANLLGVSKGKNVAVNIGSGTLTSDQEVFDAVAKATGFHGQAKYAPFRNGEVTKTYLDSKKAKSVLGWQPRTDFLKGITRAITS